MKPLVTTAALALIGAALTGCLGSDPIEVQHQVEPIEINVNVDVRVRVQKELDNFFDDIDDADPTIQNDDS